MLKVSISLGCNAFVVDGAASFTEVIPLLQTWLLISMANPYATQEELDALTARVMKSTENLAAAVNSHQP